MIAGRKVLAIIPARGGSKRLPRKNVLALHGKPLIGWSIEAAQKSKYVDTIFVSTDDSEIAEVVESFGVVVPELRPSNLSSDSATTESVVLYTLSKFLEDSSIVVILQPTSPLRQAVHVDEALELFVQREAASVVSVTACEHSPLWAGTLPDDGSMGRFFQSLAALKRSQDLDVFYRLNGAVYIYDVNAVLDKKKLEYCSKTYAYKMPVEASVDVDTLFDFKFAEFVLQT